MMRNLRNLRASACIAAFFCLTLAALPAQAWMRPTYEDDEVVARSELIVVGGIKDGSIQFVLHPHDPNTGASWEYHATLRVARVLKGKCEEKEIPVILHYGLTPLVEGHASGPNFEVNLKAPAGAPAGAVQIADTAGFGVLLPGIPDARADNLWFLRRLADGFGKSVPNADYGIADPQDLQPLELEDYFRCYLAADAEAAVRKQLARQPAVAARATRYLEYQHLRALARIADPAQRVERLLPYFRDRDDGRLANEARKAILETGNVAGPYLLAVYDSTRDPNLRDDVVRAWAQIRWPGCVDLLIHRLKEDDQFWAKQDLTPGWWNDNTNPILSNRRREVYSEVYSAVYALAQIGDPRAKEAVELTRNRWVAILFDNPQIIEECDRALKRYAEAGRAGG